MGNEHNDFKYTPERCKPDDPHRCTAQTSRGQCAFKAVPPGTTCIMHGGTHTLQKTAKSELYAIKTTAMASRIKEFKEHPEARSLSNELALTRISLEAVLNECQSPYDYIQHSGQIMQLISLINNTLQSNIKLDQRLKELLSAKDVVALAQDLLNAVATILGEQNLEMLSEIAEEFERLITYRLEQTAENPNV